MSAPRAPSEIQAAVERLLEWALLPTPKDGPTEKPSATDVMIVCDAAFESARQRQRAFDMGFKAAGGSVQPLDTPIVVWDQVIRS